MRCYIASLTGLAMLILCAPCGPLAAAKEGDNWLEPGSQERRVRYTVEHHRQPAVLTRQTDRPESPPTGQPIEAEPEDPYLEDQEAPHRDELDDECDECDDCDGDFDCDAGGFDLESALARLRRGQVFAGADYVYVRPSFSEAVALVEFNDFAGPNQTATNVEYNFDYESGLRALVGYRFCDCCCELVFNYTNFSGSATNQCSPHEDATGRVCGGPVELRTSEDGETIRSVARVDLNAYDLAFTKTATFGGCDCSRRPCCACGGDPCDSDCGCEVDFCPLWDLTWSIGARFADVDWTNGGDLLNAAGASQAAASNAMAFVGAGPRAGLEGRYYFGNSCHCSLFGRAFFSLLLGDYDIQSAQIDAGGTETFRGDYRRIIPVTEIEVGATMRYRGHFALSAGYLFQAWHDLGMTDEITNTNLPYDDANILSFDGLFARAEVAF